MYLANHSYKYVYDCMNVFMYVYMYICMYVSTNMNESAYDCMALYFVYVHV